MPNEPITFEDDIDDEQPTALDPRAVAEILAWLKLTPEERIALARRQNRVVPL